ncbi:hypothetical protein J3F83DRAFT_36904 [Trichoderma novae-zelandiae]
MKIGGAGTHTSTETHRRAHTQRRRKRKRRKAEGIVVHPTGRRRDAIGATIWGGKGGDLECSAIRILPWEMFRRCCLSGLGWHLIGSLRTVCCHTKYRLRRRLAPRMRSTGIIVLRKVTKGGGAAPPGGKPEASDSPGSVSKRSIRSLPLPKLGETRLRPRRRQVVELVTSYRPCSWLQQAAAVSMLLSVCLAFSL